MPQSGLADPAPDAFDNRWSGFSAGGEAGVTAGGVQPRCCSPPAKDKVHQEQTTPTLPETWLSGVHSHILQCMTLALILNKGLTGFPVPTCTL